MYSEEFLDNPGHYRIFVPNNKDIKSNLLLAYHDSPPGMHRGRDATYHALTRDVYWRGMGKAMKRWVEKGLAAKLIRRYAGPYTVIERLKNSDLYRLRHSISKEELPPTHVEKLILVPDVRVNDLSPAGVL